MIDDRRAGQKDQYERLQLLADLQGARREKAEGSNAQDTVSETSVVTRSGQNELRSNLPISGREFGGLSKLQPAAAPPPPPGKEPAVQVRNDFRSTAFWQPDVVTDKNGKATVKLKFPDSLTGWTATARAATAGNQFGIATASARTKQPLIVRLQAPRFFTVG